MAKRTSEAHSAHHVAAAVVASCLALPAWAQSAPRPTLPDSGRVKALLESRAAAGKGVGYVVGLVDAAGERYVAFGPREKGKPAPVDGDTVFEIGSITKAFTGVLLAQEALAGRLGLDQPVNELLPAAARLPSGKARPITLRDLATHTSGLPRMPPGFSPRDHGDPYVAYTMHDLHRSLAAVALQAEPGTVMEYSNLGFMLLSHLLVTQGGKDAYDALVRERILCPLRMDACRPGAGQAATPHDGRLRPVPPWRMPPTMGGAGSLRMSTRDLMKFAQANLAAEGALAPALAEARKVHAEAGGKATGLGWHLRTTPSGRTITWHNGGTGGSRSYVGFDRDAGTAVVILSNSAHDVTALGRHLLDPHGSPLAGH